MTRNEREHRRTLRAAMSIAAALCVLGFASLLWLHDASEGLAASSAAPLVSGTGSTASMSTGVGVPAAESVFRDAGYTAPEEPIAQF